MRRQEARGKTQEAGGAGTPRLTGGHTLVELVASMAVMTIVLGGMGSAILVASRGVDPRSPVARQVEAGQVVEQMAGELSGLVGCAQRSGTMVQFTVPDRNGDATAETIRYVWSGTAGDPLTRQYNGGTAVNVAEGVQEFALSYGLLVETQQVPGPSTESGEMLLLRHDDTGGSLSEHRVQLSRHVAEVFRPLLPGDATAWSITRVKFKAKLDGSALGQTQVQIRTADASHLPSSTVLQGFSMWEWNLTSLMTWQEFFFSTVRGRSPGEELCLVLQYVSDSTSCRIQYESGGVDTPQGQAVRTTGGSAWSLISDADLLFYIYGTVTRPGAPTPVPVGYRLREVNIRVRVGPDATTGVETAVTVLNTPEVTGP